MREVIDLPETFRIHMAVDLRGRERRVPEQLLDRPQIGAALEQVRRERVAQAVRVREEPPERAGVEPTAAHGDEERIVCAARELRPPVAQVERDDVRRLLAERYHALLAALPADVHVLLLEVDVAEVEPHASALRSPAE